jgi:DNA-binding transcriptional LysR family regulator
LLPFSSVINGVIGRRFDAGALVRVLPDWYADTGTISLYYAERALLLAKTRAFADIVTEKI